MLGPITDRDFKGLKNILNIESLDQIIRTEQGSFGDYISNENLGNELNLLKKGLSKYDKVVFEQSGTLDYFSLGPTLRLNFSKLVVERLPKGVWYRKEGLNFTTISDNGRYERDNTFHFRYSIPFKVHLKKIETKKEEFIFENWGDFQQLEVSRICLTPPSLFSLHTYTYEKNPTIIGYKLKK